MRVHSVTLTEDLGMVGALSSREFPPNPELQRQNRVSLTLDERESIVRRIVELLVDCHQSGNSPAEVCRGLRISDELRSLAFLLWLDGADDE